MAKEVRDLGRRRRFTVDLPERLAQRLDELASEHNLSDASAVRNAVKILVELNQLKKEGYHIGGWKESEGCRDSVRVSIGI